MVDFQPFGPRDAAAWIAVPDAESDKYSRGVLGMITGSAAYPGAAVLGVDAALHTGVGMVRYLGDARAADLVLQRRPEVVTAPGRVQAWLIGSGIDHAERDAEREAAIARALGEGHPVVLDGGALAQAERRHGPVIVTPHAGELARLLDVAKDAVLAAPEQSALRAAERYGVAVLIKGSTTFVTDGSAHLSVTGAPAWLATAGAGDALGGVLGALVATHASAIADDPGALVSLGATAALLHGRAASLASDGGPFTILELIARLPRAVAETLG